MPQAHVVLRTLSALALLLTSAGCGVHFRHLPEGSVTGRTALYDYSPTAIRTGSLVKIWWCGGDANPSDVTQFSDTIQYKSFDAVTGKQDGPTTVLGESQFKWDSVYTCNPKVVQGQFVNPLGNGMTYSYAMYYVGLGPTGNNSIGVAFSKDGIAWKKYPKPIINAQTSIGYGVGQPAVLNVDHGSAIRMFYESYDYYIHHVEATSIDGVHFTDVGTLTTNGLDPRNANPNWGDMAFDPVTGYWYAGFQTTATRDPSTTGGISELGQYAIELYRIPDGSVLTGATPWQLLTIVDTNSTGYESNFIPSFVRDPYGNLNVGAYPSIQMYTSIANPQPPWDASPALAGAYGSISNWNIGSATWVPNQPIRTLNRYFNQKTHEVTTGYIDPKGGFTLEKTLGHLYESPQQGATLAIYGCKAGSTQYLVSLDDACGGARILGTNGYGYDKPVAGLPLVPLYFCTTSTDYLVSNDQACEGLAPGSGYLLGYALP